MTSAIASMDMMPCRASGSASGASWARTRRWLFRNDCRGAWFDANIRSDLQFAVFAIFVRSADTTSSTIRKITPAGVVTTVVGISAYLSLPTHRDRPAVDEADAGKSLGVLSLRLRNSPNRPKQHPKPAAAASATEVMF
jgi:hypothetical protein